MTKLIIIYTLSTVHKRVENRDTSVSPPVEQRFSTCDTRRKSPPLKKKIGI